MLPRAPPKTTRPSPNPPTPSLDRSQSLFYFVPQEKVILTVKLARLMQTRQMKPFSGWTLWTSSFAASLRVTKKCLCDIVGSSKVFEFLN